MTIVDTEEATPWPFLWVDIGPALGWQQICYDGHPIFIIISDQTLVGVSGVSPNNTCSLCRGLRWIIVWNNNLMCWLDAQSFVVFRHDIAFAATSYPHLFIEGLFLTWGSFRRISVRCWRFEIKILFFIPIVLTIPG
jgi:hypothetical protein